MIPPQLPAAAASLLPKLHPVRRVLSSLSQQHSIQLSRARRHPPPPPPRAPSAFQQAKSTIERREEGEREKEREAAAAAAEKKRKFDAMFKRL